jgi:hypothetical protein
VVEEVLVRVSLVEQEEQAVQVLVEMELAELTTELLVLQTQVQVAVAVLFKVEVLMSKGLLVQEVRVS